MKMSSMGRPESISKPTQAKRKDVLRHNVPGPPDETLHGPPPSIVDEITGLGMWQVVAPPEQSHKAVFVSRPSECGTEEQEDDTVPLKFELTRHDDPDAEEDTLHDANHPALTAKHFVITEKVLDEPRDATPDTAGSKPVTFKRKKKKVDDSQTPLETASMDYSTKKKLKAES